MKTSGPVLRVSRRCALFVAFILGSALLLAGPSVPTAVALADADPGSRAVRLANELWSVSIDPATLEVVAEPADGVPYTISAGIVEPGSAADVRREGNECSWELPDQGVSVRMSLDEGNLAVTVRATDPGSFTWPTVPLAGPATALIWPHWEGSYIPLDDARWIERLMDAGGHDTLESLSMPFWGIDCGEYSLTYIVTNPYNNEIRFQRDGESLTAGFTHEFPPNHAPREYGFVISLGENETPVEPALRFRRWLIDQGRFVDMDQKKARTPNVERLLGAAHVYLWGGGYLGRKDVRNPTNRWSKVWKPFCRQVIQESESEEPTVGRRIKSLMGKDPWDAVVEMTKVPYDYQYLQRDIASELSRLVALPEFYDEASWKGIDLPEEAAGLLAGDRSSLSAVGLSRMNGLLLCAAYPEFFAPIDEWGDGLSIAMLKRFEESGIDRLRICLDGWEGVEQRPEVAEEADRMGYLFGTYDSFHSIHDPKWRGTDSTWTTAQFNQELYETGAITLRDGTKKHGFKKRGYLLSPIAARPYVEERVNANFRNVPYNYYFVDCDAYGQVFDDYTPGREATQHEGAMARNDRLAWIRDTHGVVIGSEGGSSYSAPVVHVVEGMFLSAFGWGDPDLKDRDSEYYMGAYYPPDGPGVFFKPAKLKEKYRYFHLDPRFRLPLYETVFHDSVVAASHWSHGNLKFPDEADLIFLTQILYQVPPLYHVNSDSFAERMETIGSQYAVFSPLHREIGFAPMTGFAWLTPDRMVQRAVFDDRVEIVANFTDKEFGYDANPVPAGGILVRWKDSGRTEVHAPGD